MQLVVKKRSDVPFTVFKNGIPTDETTTVEAGNYATTTVVVQGHRKMNGNWVTIMVSQQQLGLNQTDLEKYYEAIGKTYLPR